jgi:hypothetical protein
MANTGWDPQTRRGAVDEIEQTAGDEDVVDTAQNIAEDSILGFSTSLGYRKIDFT